MYLRIDKNYFKIRHHTTFVQYFIYFAHTDHILKICNSAIVFYSKLKLENSSFQIRMKTIIIYWLYTLVHVYWQLLSNADTNFGFRSNENIPIKIILVWNVTCTFGYFYISIYIACDKPVNLLSFKKQHL